MDEHDVIDHLEGIVGAASDSYDSRVANFSGLLKDIESLDDKKRQLWKEIYENAIIDRQNAYVMFAKLVRITKDLSTEHAVHARSMTSYIERMSRANEQLIKLAELIAQAERASNEIDTDSLFDQIGKSKF